jgi:DNA-binding NarL/FixJ family response regulator
VAAVFAVSDEADGVASVGIAMVWGGKASPMMGPQHYGLLGRLSPCEIAVAFEVGVLCSTSKEAGRHLGVSYRTIEVQRGEIFRKLNITHGIAELARRMALAEAV